MDAVPHDARERLLRDSLAAWRGQGLLTAEQHAALLATVAGPIAPPSAVVNERSSGAASRS